MSQEWSKLKLKFKEDFKKHLSNPTTQSSKVIPSLLELDINASQACLCW